MSVPILDATAWREFRGKPSNSGINETAHLAKIADPTGKLRDCFVKLLPLEYPALLGEAIGWLLARSSDVACVPFAAIVIVPLDELRKSVDLPPEFDNVDACPAWCCEVAGKAVRQVNKWAYWLSRRNCLNSKDARKIASFDQWADLRDRHFGNVIRGTGGDYISIDHETILYDVLWVRRTKKRFRLNSLLETARKELPPNKFLRFQVEMVSATNKHAPGLAAASADIADITNTIYPNHAGSLVPEILAALDQRSQTDWLADRLGVIA